MMRELIKEGDRDIEHNPEEMETSHVIEDRMKATYRIIFEKGSDRERTQCSQIRASKTFKWESIKHKLVRLERQKRGEAVNEVLFFSLL